MNQTEVIMELPSYIQNIHEMTNLEIYEEIKKICILGEGIEYEEKRECLNRELKRRGHEIPEWDNIIKYSRSRGMTERRAENKGHIKIEWIPGELITFEGVITKEEIRDVLINTPYKNQQILNEMEKLANCTGRISDRLMALSEFYKLKEDLEEKKRNE